MPTKICGHRGARGLAPENTLPAFELALALGVDYIELDVLMSKDKVLVVSHDIHLNPDITRNSHGKWIESGNHLVKDLTLAQLQTYDVGCIKPDTDYGRLFPEQEPFEHTCIPTLQQVIQLVKNHKSKKIGLLIEIKTNPTHPHDTFTPDEIARAIAELIEHEKVIDRVFVLAFDFHCLLALQKTNPRIATCYLTHREQSLRMHSNQYASTAPWTAEHFLKDYQHSIPKMIAALGGKMWGAEDIELTPALVKEAHSIGLQVMTWSWPEKSGIEFDAAHTESLMEMCIDILTTDRPDMLIRKAKTAP